MPFSTFRSSHPRMAQIFELISDVGQTNSTVLIEGETGTGKEVAAGAIHAAATHRSGPLVAVNCAALPETLLESELFGHEKGAFTSAVSERKGRFELADGGTLFLDEIGDVPASMQAKLLRVLQERCFERVGGTATIAVDVRVVAASNRSLLQLVKEGKFREDLFYRLNVVKIDLPPLRERTEDIALLAAHFLTKHVRPGEPAKQIASAAMNVLLKYSWPGNIRELENVIERLCVTTKEHWIQVDDLPAEIRFPRKCEKPREVNLNIPLAKHLGDALAEIECEYIRKALERTNGHVGKCAMLCGLSRRSITVKMAQYGLTRIEFKNTLATPEKVTNEHAFAVAE